MKKENKMKTERTGAGINYQLTLSGEEFWSLIEACEDCAEVVGGCNIPETQHCINHLLIDKIMTPGTGEAYQNALNNINQLIRFSVSFRHLARMLGDRYGNAVMGQTPEEE